MSLHYKHDNRDPDFDGHGYANANYATNVIDRKSVSGYILFVMAVLLS
jgi:hypothetical protein